MSDERAMQRPWLSVIVPCHNGERWLAAALQSVVDQKDGGIEVIVIDGSATDASLKIVDSFADKLQIRAERRPDLQSWTAKTNFGVAQARGDRISMLHQDDLWLPTRCAEIRKWLSTQFDGVIHLHSCYIIDESARRLGLWRCPLPAGQSPVPAHMLIERLLVQNFIGIPAPTIRREAYLSVGGLDNALWYTADWDLYLKLAAVGRVYYHPSPLACFRVHKNSLTVSGSRNSADFRDQHQAIIDRHADKLSPEARAEILPVAAVVRFEYRARGGHCRTIRSNRQSIGLHIDARPARHVPIPLLLENFGSNVSALARPRRRQVLSGFTVLR